MIEGINLLHYSKNMAADKHNCKINTKVLFSF